MADNSIYRTSDTSLASFLITEHLFLISIDYTQPRFVYLFQESDSLREAANNYLSGNALTDPSAFSRVNKKLMRVIRKQCQWGED